MIARLHIAVPFNMAIPVGVELQVYTYEDHGYDVTVFPPTRTSHPLIGTPPDRVKVDGAEGLFVNGLTIQFEKETFDRRRNAPMDGHDFTIDPPAAVVMFVVNSFLGRLRYVTRGHMVQLVSALPVPWRLSYLNDDGSELKEDPELLRARFAVGFSSSFVGINPAKWKEIHDLNPDFKAPVWDDLRLDALAALPNIGTAIVLAFASLETFIARILDALERKSGLPPELWTWINTRDHFSKEPSTPEQFDVLLRVLTGHSLKDDDALWESFQNLRKARNSFIHEGVATIDKKRPVSESESRQLVRRVDEIIKWVRQWLPEDVRWSEFGQTIKVETSFVLINASPETPEGSPPGETAGG